MNNKSEGFSFLTLDKPFIIAEMSANHQNSLEHAIKIVEAAADCGVDALKLQTYTAETMTIDVRENEFYISDKKSLWYGSSLFDLYQKAHLPWEWHAPIAKRCEELGLHFFSTPFDFTAVDFLEKLNVPFYKIASFENTDLPLIKRVAQTKKPMIISTGMANVAEIYEAVRTARENGCNDLTLLKCTSSYPANHCHANLRTLSNMKETFGCHVGISDHTPGIGTAVASIALGAMVIEKHMTLSRKDEGPDSAFSLEPHEMKLLVEESKRAYQSLGTIHYGPSEGERGSLIYRRSLYVVKDIEQGELFTPENIRAIRPSLGLAPRHYEHLVNKRKAKEKVKRGTALSWELVD
jgi:pseudaminic acid synthase